MHEELNPITRLQPKMFTDRFRDGGLALDGDRGLHLSLHYILTNVIPRLQPARQAGNSPKVLHLSGQQGQTREALADYEIADFKLIERRDG
jgi:hypothetical protein